MSTLKTTYIQHPSATDPAIELEADGTVLIPSIPPPDLSNLDASNLTSGTVNKTRLPAGLVIDVKEAIFTSTQSTSATAGADFAVTNLSIAHSLSSASNRLLITAYLGTAANGHGYGNVGLAVKDGSTFIGVGDAASSRPRVGAGGFSQGLGTHNNIVTSSPSVSFVYSPGDTTSRTYTVRAINLDTSTQTIYINRNIGDSNDARGPRGTSGLVIQEIQA